jgi:hypothetical protein
MKKLLLILLCLPMIGFGQEWETTFGGTDGDEGYFVQQTTDLGYIVCGKSYLFGLGEMIYLIKTDGQGDTVWTKTFGNGPYSVARSIQQTTDEGYIIVGTWLIKTDEYGNIEWINEDISGSDVEQTTDGGYIIIGERLIKTNIQGDTVWTKTFAVSMGYFLQGMGYSVQQTSDGGYIFCGIRDGLNSPYENFIIKTDSVGNQEWDKIYMNTNNINSLQQIYNGKLELQKGISQSNSIQQTSDGGYIFVGGIGVFNVYLIKLDINGDSLWTKTFEGDGTAEGFSVQQTTDGGYIICGYTSGNGNFEDVYLIKTDGNGVQQWSKTYGGSSSDVGCSVQQTTDGGYIICGYTQSFGNGFVDIYLIKTDGNGNVTSTFNIPTPSSNRKLEKVVDVLGRETKHKTNTPFIEIYDDGTVEKRIVIE